MFKEILQIVPQLNSSDLNNMEKSLSSRFSNVARKFGKGLIASLTGGGLAGAALGLVDKFLNPLREVQEAIDRTLSHGSELSVQAKQFNSSAGELAKLQAFGQSKGIDNESLNRLIEKFQTAVSEAVADPTKNTSVRNFTGQKDIVQGFFDFIQQLQKLDKNQQLQVQEEVFGQKQILRMSDFLNADFTKLDSQFKNIDVSKVTQAAEKTKKLDELSHTVGAVTGLQDFVNKSGKINQDMILLRNDQEKRKLELENKQIASYESLSNIEAASTELLDAAKEGILHLTNMAVKVTNLSENVKKVVGSRWIRGLIGGGKDD